MPFVARPVALADAPTAGPGVLADRAWLDCERPNLLAAVDQAAGAGDVRGALALAGRLMGHQCVTGAYADAMSSLRAVAVAAALVGDAECQPMAEYYLAVTVAESREQVGEAIALLVAALPELERTGRVDLAAMGYGLLGRCLSADGRHAAAIRAVRHAIRLAEPGDDLAGCCASAVLGLTLARVGIVHAGLEHCHEALNQARRLREPAYEAYATRTIAQALILGGHYAAAMSACSDGIDASAWVRQRGDRGQVHASARARSSVRRRLQAGSGGSARGSRELQDRRSADRGDHGPQHARRVQGRGGRPRRCGHSRRRG